MLREAVHAAYPSTVGACAVEAHFECTGNVWVLEARDSRVPPLWEDTEVREHFLSGTLLRCVRQAR